MATIEDVAKHARVSIATVSRVLNGSAGVGDETRKRVEAAIAALDYRPNPAARSLRSNRSRIIGLLISDIQNPFFAALIRGVEDEALRHEYSLILCNSDESPQREQQYLEVLYLERVAGIIVVPTREQLAQDIRKRYRDRGIPIVTVDRRVKDQDIDAVLSDNVLGGHEAVAHLIANGYRRIGAVTGPQAVTTGRERLEGYRKALHEAGIPLDPALERSGAFTVASGRELTEQLLDLTPPPDAIFAGNNLLTLGALHAIHDRDLKVPDDIALVGYDDIPWAELGTISLTTVTQPVYELGSTAALRLFQRMTTPPDQIQGRREIILAPTLRVRGSSGPRGNLAAAAAGNETQRRKDAKDGRK
jgi:DNA-binding LacI/PurR family transcriptional regulator